MVTCTTTLSLSKKKKKAQMASLEIISTTNQDFKSFVVIAEGD